MCRIEQHTCVCREGLRSERTKLLMTRMIVCAADVDCPDRDDMPIIIIIRCADFHKIPARELPYRCARCSCDSIRLNVQLEPDTEVRATLAMMDRDCLTRFDHLEKRVSSGRTYFLRSSFRTGYMDVQDEFVSERYRTGYMYLERPDGQLVRIPDGQRRGQEETEGDNLTGNFQSDGEESSSDELYDSEDDPDGDP